MSVAEGFEPFAVWEQEDLALFVPPHPDHQHGRWVTIKQLRDLFAAHGPSYVEHFQPGWAAADHAAVHESMEASLHQMRTALGCRDVDWALICWDAVVQALAQVHPDAAVLINPGDEP